MMIRGAQLVGRAKELAELQAIAGQVKNGAGRFAVLEGEPGIGKTRLVEETISLVEQQGFRVLRAAGEEIDRDRPFGLLVDALQISMRSPDPERARVARLLLESPQTGPSSLLLHQATDLRFFLIDALCDLIERTAAEGPLTLVAEDLHWADPSSLLTLYRLTRRIAHLPVLLLVNCRPTPRSTELERLLEQLRLADALYLPLAPLEPEAVSELVDQLVGARAGPRLSQSIVGAAGNPLFVTELVRALQQEEVILVQAGMAELERQIDPPPSLRLTILRCMNCLSQETLQILRMASILGQSFSYADLSICLARSSSDLLPAIEEAIRSGFINDAGAQLEFRHNIVHDALYHELPGAVRKGLHLQAGRALAASDAPARQVAVQMALGASPGDSEAAAWLHRAARELAPRAPAAAVDMLERALELLGPEDPAANEILADLLLPLIWTARMEQAQQCARVLLARTTDPRLSFAVYRGLASMFFLQQRMPELAQLCEEALATPWLRPADHAYFRGLSTIPLLAMGRVEEALARSTAAIDVGHQHNSMAAVLFGLWPRAQVAVLRGFYGQAAELVTGYIALARQQLQQASPQQAETPDWKLRLAVAQLISAWVLISADQLETAVTALQAAQRDFEQLGAATYMSMCHRALANAYFLAGDWDDALAEVQAARFLAEESGIHGLRAHQGDAAPLMHLHRGQLSEMERDIGLIDEALGADEHVVARLWVLPLKGLVAEAQTRPEAALHLFEQTCLLAEQLSLLPDYRVFGASMVRIALTIGRRDLAQRAADGAAELSRRAMELPSAQGIALLCQGLLDDDISALLGAVEAYRRSPRLLDLAIACEEAARALVSCDRAAEARLLLLEGLGIYERLGAARDQARAIQMLRLTGVRRRSYTPRTRNRVGWGSLTPTELKILELLAEGLSNPAIGDRLYISRRTVQTHVSNIFGKLGVSSRTELAALTARRMAQSSRSESGLAHQNESYDSVSGGPGRK